MTEQTQPLDTFLKEYEEKMKMKEIFNRFGWMLFALIVGWYSFIVAAVVVIKLLDATGIPAMAFYERYMLIFNEIGLGFGIMISMLVLKSLPKYEITHEKLGFKRFLKYLTIGMAIGMAGNLIAQVLLAFWNGVTGNEAGGEVDEVLLGSDYLISFLMIGIVAPLLEEFVFRKLLIDHARQYGELTCILTSGVLFALFHGNITQFFYAFGLGALFAYVYLRSGNFFVIYALHAVFNIISGILPAMVLEKGSALTLILYSFSYLAVVITGVVLLIIGLQGFKPKKGEVSLPKKTMVASVILNPGMIAASLLMIALMVLSLFTV